MSDLKTVGDCCKYLALHGIQTSMLSDHLFSNAKNLKVLINKTKSDAVEQARLSVVIHSPSREGTFIDGADWAFDEISDQLENYAKELKGKDQNG